MPNNKYDFSLIFFFLSFDNSFYFLIAKLTSGSLVLTIVVRLKNIAISSMVNDHTFQNNL